MITFEGDERFADVEVAGLAYNRERRVLTLSVSADPADGSATILLREVAAFDVVHFGAQNVVHRLDIARVAAADSEAFLDQIRSEGASPGPAADPVFDTVLGTVFVPANGATIFGLCRSVEKCVRDGRPVYRVTA